MSKILRYHDQSVVLSPEQIKKAYKQLQKEFSKQLFLEVRKEKFGLGTAYIHGFKWCLDKGYQYNFVMDADFSHDPRELKEKIDFFKKHELDMLIASRYTKNSKILNNIIIFGFFWLIGQIISDIINFSWSNFFKLFFPISKCVSWNFITSSTF